MACRGENKKTTQWVYQFIELIDIDIAILLIFVEELIAILSISIDEVYK